jgi:phosphoribosyl-ATP pyrophosphohydrolase
LRLPDLFVDSFLWGFSKSGVNVNKPITIQQLKADIREETTPEILIKVMENAFEIEVEAKNGNSKISLFVALIGEITNIFMYGLTLYKNKNRKKFQFDIFKFLKSESQSRLF